MKDITEKMSIRITHTNPDHHIWSNNGTYYLHYTVHIGPTKARCRESLHTRDIEKARQLRDARLHLPYCAA
jgi:hypothetical protein